MKDLVQVFKILNVCADRVNEQPRYEQFLIDILKICSLPFLQEKSSDELIYEQIVIESISQLGKYFIYFNPFPHTPNLQDTTFKTSYQTFEKSLKLKA